MELVLIALVAWLALSVLGVLGAAAVCRAGHVEDVARGFIDLDDLGAVPQVPLPRTQQAEEVTHR